MSATVSGSRRVLVLAMVAVEHKPVSARRVPQNSILTGSQCHWPSSPKAPKRWAKGRLRNASCPDRLRGGAGATVDGHAGAV